MSSPWNVFLREVTLRVPDASGVADYHARLLGGESDGATVRLGSNTVLRYEEGPTGFAGAAFDVAHGADDEATDPDGRPFAFRGADSPQATAEAQEPRLGHVTFESPDPIAAQRWFEGRGFLLTEGLAEQFRWLRCNPIHHTVAFARGERAATHHVGIEVPDRAALVAACDRVADAGERVQYGPGRHFVGNNVFIYFVDRHGIRFEVFCELERVPDANRAPVVHEQVERSRSINLWGPQPDQAYWGGF